MFRSTSLAAAAVLLAAPLYAQDTAGKIDSIFSFATAETPGCAVGVSRNGTVLVNRAYGLANVERRVPLGRRAVERVLQIDPTPPGHVPGFAYRSRNRNRR